MEWAGSRSILGNGAQMPLLTLTLAAQQFAWGIEQAYVSRFLRSLGISKSNLAIVWVAGPLSGLVVQPVIGAISDYSTWRSGRRRPYMLFAAMVVAAALVVFGYAEDIAILCGIKPLPIAIAAVVAMDLFINVCGATSRALIVDSVPQSRQDRANAWAAKMSTIGHLLSYLMCSVDMQWVLGSQIKSVCVVSAALLLSGVGITCAAVSERYLVSKPARKWSNITRMLKASYRASMNLDSVLASIFKVQLFGWYAWFTFIFFGADWAAETWQRANPDSTPDEIARAGSRALLVFAVSAVLFSLPLPPRNCKATRLWLISWIWYTLETLLLPLSLDYCGILVFFGLLGFPWSITCWAPFALVANRIHELPPAPVDTNQVTVQQVIMVNDDPENDMIDQATENSGIYLGLHNTAISFPQIISSFGTWLVFRVIETSRTAANAYAVNIMFGSFFAFIAVLYIYRLEAISRSVELQ